jgi:hypothetical protein
VTITSTPTDLGFTYRANARGVVEISRGGRGVVTLRGNAAAKFLAKAEGATMEAVQQLCARVTGNYKRGNEAVGSAVRRGKGRDA